ncbi:MAG: hypothetical protein AB7O89_06365 [Parachlamydiales bacterium]
MNNLFCSPQSERAIEKIKITPHYPFAARSQPRLLHLLPTAKVHRTFSCVRSLLVCPQSFPLLAKDSAFRQNTFHIISMPLGDFHATIDLFL